MGDLLNKDPNKHNRVTGGLLDPDYNVCESASPAYETVPVPTGTCCTYRYVLLYTAIR